MADGQDTGIKRGEIKDSVRNALWAQAAGRRTICNRRILGDSRTRMCDKLAAALRLCWGRVLNGVVVQGG